MDEEEKRIKAILGEEISLTYKNSEIYMDYLNKSIERPCMVKGSQDFPWEERYVVGHWNPDEYEKLKKYNPSYTDEFELMDFIGIDMRFDIIAKIKRPKDGKIFKMGLSWLESIDHNCLNHQLIWDFCFWHVTY